MARYQVILAYDGSGFQGSQRQAKSDGSSSLQSISRPRTVQGDLEESLRKVGWTGKSVILAGRTDTGVHATGQVAAFDLDWTHGDEKLLKALNAELPPDLAVKSLCEASVDFHPRFDATSRRYRYRLFCEPIRDPLREKFAWRVWPAVDGRTLDQTAGLFLGTHDFAAFGSPTTPKGTTVRTVTKAEWKKMPDGEWHFEVQADAFLYRMVRRLVFVQVSISQGKSSDADILDALKEQTRLRAGLAPAHGLTLVEVKYGSH
jgi:tRNA pseudouridine38-40 synthase